MSEDRTYDPASERRANDRRRGGTGTVTEPVAAETEGTDPQVDRAQADTTYGTTREPMTSEPIESQRTSRQMDYWPEMAQYRQKFDEIQSQFIEEPRQAVRKAEQLVEEAIDRMSTSMRERIQSMHRDAETGDTEKLRLEMKALRDFIESMGGRRAA